MEIYKKLVLMTEIASGVNCELEHHDEEDHIAVNCIVQPVGGYADEIAIMVCEDCANTLANDSEWALLYCLDCNSSQWLYLPLAKYNHYDYSKINWLERCPKCNGGKDG